MSNLKSWKDLPMPYKKVSLWSAPDELDVYVRTISSKKQLEILEQVQKRYSKEEMKGADSQHTRDLFFNQLLAYECTRDKNGNKLGTYEEFCETVDGEDIDRISKAYNQLIVSKSHFSKPINEDRMKLLEEYVNNTPYEDFDGLIEFHLDKILEHLESIKSVKGSVEEKLNEI